ncbi:beta-N-acetylhexosaminidase [Paenibacillus sacheonensis]|uniref:beta-N-acetylhexosaminidase n=1 Tax=Paenibacillus sacheonensis TaxID=742054 RepID=A0A7X4YV39_9BACL|nr:beta-N-acetylhexosaminidase [Paenibacillus sacheonensis]MBM7566575.1 beta-N-acetylhexosaminidase [Paenibacillus sacheonensis]NBC73075.1 beta-N-acetylhexosaminidase [Paenibacillus sacheonensis]
MKKIGLILLALSIALVSGCGTSENHEGTTGGGTTPSGSVEPPKTPADGNPPSQTPDQPDHTSGNEPSQPPAEPNDSGSAPSQPADPEEPAEQPPTPAELAAEQLKRMSLDEKLGEMVIAGLDGTEASAQTKALIQQQHVGGFIFYKNNVTTPAGVAAYVNQLKAWNKANPSPLLISVDQEGGRVSRLPGLLKFPAARVIGDTGDVSYASAIGSALGQASKLMGFNVDFAPVLDINSNPDNPVIGDRSYGTTSKRVTDMGLAVMEAIQKKGVISVVKHFPGHGDTSVDSHLELPVVNKSLSQLKKFEWLPFQAAIKDGVDMVMVAHILFPSIDKAMPASLSKTIITDQLRGELGYRGVVITDDMTMGAIANHFGLAQAAVTTVKAGSDIILLAHGYEDAKTVLTALKQSIQKGGLTEKRIDESVIRILTMKQKYKLSDAAVGAHPDVSGVNAAIKKAIAGH